jgi:periplasmic divalent cation tolerance protein
MEINSVYITAANKQQARDIAKALVEEKLAACVNIFDNVNSFYIWDGALQDDQEVAMIAKTRAGLLTVLIERVKSLHSYDCPCIVALPISGGNPEYLAWIKGMLQ